VRVLVTGAGGFVGPRLVARLQGAGATITARDRELDVSDPARIAACLAEVRPDAIVHLAALSFVPASFGEPRAVYRVNYLGAHALLAAARQHAPDARVLLVGSGAEYGSAPPGAAPFDERAPLRPESPYARCKAAADLLGATFAAQGQDVLRVRPFNHIGPGQRDEFVAASFARQIAEIEAGRRTPRLEVGNLDSVRDFLDVDDVVDAYVRLLDRAVPAGAYNVASGRGVSIRALLAGLLRHSSVSPEIVTDRTRLRPTDQAVGDAGKLAGATGWRPVRPLDATLAGLLADWRTRLAREDR
jgi:GDP-4-dehydro-6-deoxy-D-mannose reductase